MGLKSEMWNPFLFRPFLQNNKINKWQNWCIWPCIITRFAYPVSAAFIARTIHDFLLLLGAVGYLGLLVSYWMEWASKIEKWWPIDEVKSICIWLFDFTSTKCARFSVSDHSGCAVFLTDIFNLSLLLASMSCLLCSYDSGYLRTVKL